MNGYKVKKKPTVKEITNSVLELNNRTNYLFDLFKELERAFSIYIEMNKDTENFTKFVNKKIKEWKQINDTKTNEISDKEDIPKDSGDERSGSEGVRKGSK